LPASGERVAEGRVRGGVAKKPAREPPLSFRAAKTARNPLPTSDQRTSDGDPSSSARLRMTSLALDLELRGRNRERFVEDEHRFGDRKKHGVIPLLHFEDDFVVARLLIDRDQSPRLPFDLERAV